MPNILFALHRIGPYHHSRFAAIPEDLQLHVLETRPQSIEYPWAFKPDALYKIYQLSGHLHTEADPPLAILRQQLIALLDRVQPQVIASVGWDDNAYLALLVLAHQRQIPMVIVTDSRQRDKRRSAGKEWIKQQLLRGYSSAIVSGHESRGYLTDLGFPPSAIAQPWDVVDNVFFSNAARNSFSSQPHFLCVSRLVYKKNHFGLLKSYATYQRQGGLWGLQFVGSGPLEPAIRAQIADLPNPHDVYLFPFCQLEQLGHFYGRASAFVLASTTDQWGLVVNEAMAVGLPSIVSRACGCATDLIEHNVSGWSFDPTETSALCDLMHEAEHQTPPKRKAMQLAAKQRLQAFTPDAFAAGLKQAVKHAIARPRFSQRAAASAALLCLRT
jgi:glycosyltransferase involved in cell wall biosynthesis